MFFIFFVLSLLTASFNRRSVANPMSMLEIGTNELSTEGIIHC